MRVNLTSEEAESRTLDPLPTGKYLCNLVDGQIREVKPGRKHVGKPFWSLQFVVQEGPHAGRNIFATVMLFEGALYSLVQLLRAYGYEVNGPGELQVPSLDDLLDKKESIYVRGQKKPATSANGNDLPERFEVKGYTVASKAQGASADSSYLP